LILLHRSEVAERDASHRSDDENSFEQCLGVLFLNEKKSSRRHGHGPEDEITVLFDPGGCFEIGRNVAQVRIMFLVLTFAGIGTLSFEAIDPHGV
jgi:hypothetical protein